MDHLSPSRARILFALGFIGASWLRHHHIGESVDSGQPEMAWVQLGYMLLSFALSAAAGALLAKKNKATIKDDKPTTLVTRGSYMNWVLGVRRVGPLFSWAGERFSTNEKTGKKGLFGSSPKTKIWHESGAHLLAVGPGFCLHQILDNGKAVFKGPISRDSHPSGTFVDLGGAGGFYIYWGEATQPINTRLGDASRLGVASRWPYHFYIEWAPKRLGPSPNWSLLDYEIEVRVEDVVLTTHNNPHMAATKALSGAITTILALSTLNDTVTLEGAHAHEYLVKGIVRTLGIPGVPDQDVGVLLSEIVQELIGIHPGTLLPIYRSLTVVYLEAGSLAGGSTGGSIQAYTMDLNFGINAAHAFATMLFNKWPRGLGLPQTGDESQWDINEGLFSLENLATLLDENNEDLRTSWLSQGGDSVEILIGTGLQDLGVMAPLNATSGKIEFRPVRAPSGILKRIRDDALVDSLPEIEVVHIDTSPDRVTFSFPDRNLTDRDATIAVMEDGKISRLETQHARNVQITITTDYKTASAIAQRRSQEELGQGAVTKLKTNRATRTLVPGQAITIDQLPEIQRVESVQIDPETNKVTLKVVGDFYGVPKTPFVDIPPPAGSGFKSVQPDIIKAVFEVPEIALGTDAQTVLIPRVRAHDQISQAQLHISRSNVTYTPQAVEFGLQTGGLTNAILPAPNQGGADDSEGGLMLMEVGPEFDLLGPDIGIVEDLSLDPTNWRLGRQWCIISSLAGQELCYVRNVTFVSGGTWRADGLIRARLGTLALEHPAGAKLFIFSTDDIEAVQDQLLSAQVSIFAKTQPAAGGILPLDADTPVSTLLYGKGINLRPDMCSGLSVIAPDLVNAYTTAQDIGLRWSWPNAQSSTAGAGLQGAGVAVNFPAFDGDFFLEIRNVAGTVVERTESLSSNSYTYTNANLVADLGSEISFQVWVYTRRGGLLADPIKLLVEKH